MKLTDRLEIGDGANRPLRTAGDVESQDISVIRGMRGEVREELVGHATFHGQAGPSRGGEGPDRREPARRWTCLQ